MRNRLRWLVPPAGVLAVAAPVGLARAPDGTARAEPAVLCAAQGFGEGGVSYPGDPPSGATRFTEAGADVTITNDAGRGMAWTSSVPIAAVLVRGGGATQSWPTGRATSGAGVRGPGDGSAPVAVDDVTFCFPGPAPPAPAPLRPVGLGVLAQGTFTRVPARVDVHGIVNVDNPNDRPAPVDGLDVSPSTRGTCAIVAPLEVPSGTTPIAFTCDIDIADAARQGTVDVTARSRSAGASASTTVRWAEASPSH